MLLYLDFKTTLEVPYQDLVASLQNKQCMTAVLHCHVTTMLQESRRASTAASNAKPS